MTPPGAHSPNGTQLRCPAIPETCRPGEGILLFMACHSLRPPSPAARRARRPAGGRTLRVCLGLPVIARAAAAPQAPP